MIESIVAFKAKCLNQQSYHGGDTGRVLWGNDLINISEKADYFSIVDDEGLNSCGDDFDYEAI